MKTVIVNKYICGANIPYYIKNDSAVELFHNLKPIIWTTSINNYDFCYFPVDNLKVVSRLLNTQIETINQKQIILKHLGKIDNDSLTAIRVNLKVLV